mmetsp:Transcript_17397/g.48908  ORF Transcript_17397/g.48908 Transcript_17397/m.48908 type:complete len:148 (+) Transcript_17397:96-539(+)
MNTMMVLSRGVRSVCLSARRGYATEVFSVDTMNANLRKMQYAVRGVVVARAEEHKETLCAGAELPFKEIIHCNIGNPQEVGNPPITYIRQLSSLTNYPELADYEHAADIFPADVIEKARLITSLVNTGAYSHSQGHHLFREWISKFI